MNHVNSSIAIPAGDNNVIIPGVIVSAVTANASTYAESFSVGPIIKTAAGANVVKFEALAGGAGNIMTLTGIPTAAASGNLTGAAGTALGVALNNQNAYSGLIWDGKNVANATLAIDTTGNTRTTQNNQLVISELLNTGGAQNNAATVAIGNEFVKFSGANLLGVAANQNIVATIGNGALTIDSTAGLIAGGLNAGNEGLNVQFTGAAANGALTINANTNALTLNVISALNDGAGAVTVTGNSQLTVTGKIGHGNAIASLTDNNNNTAMGVRDYQGAITSKGDVKIGQTAAVGGNISVNAINSTTGKIEIQNKTGAITTGALLKGAKGITIKGDNAININVAGLTADTGDVTILQTGATALNGNAAQITATEDSISVSTSNAALVGGLGNLTAVKGDVTLKTGNAAGITATAVETGKLTLDSSAVAAASVFTFGGANTHLSKGLDIKGKDGVATTVNVLDSANTYITAVTTNASGKNILNFATAGANSAYVGNVGTEANHLAELEVSNVGSVVIVNGSTVYADIVTFNNGNIGKLVLGNNTVINASGGVKALGGVAGTIKLESNAFGAVDDVTKAMNPHVSHAAATVTAKINANNIGAGFAIDTIDFGMAGDGSSLTINGAAASDVAVYANGAKSIRFSGTAGAKGTLALTGGNNHTLVLNAAANSIANAEQGTIFSDTNGTLKITGGFGEENDIAGQYDRKSLAAITAPTANITLDGAEVYVKDVTMKVDGTLTIGNVAASKYMIGKLTDNVKIALGGNDVTLQKGTNLGTFSTLTLSGVQELKVSDNVDLAGTKISAAANNTGIITFTGNSNVTAEIGDSKTAVAAVQVNPAAAAAVNLGNVYSVAGVTVNGGAAATLNVSGNIGKTTGAAITSKSGNNKVVFTNAADKAITLSGDIASNAAANNFTSISVGAGTVNVQNATTIATNQIIFTGAGTLNFTGMNAGGADLAGALITGPDAGTGTISVDANLTRTADIGAVGTNSALAINLSKEATIDLLGFNAFANFTTSNPGVGTIIVQGKGGNDITAGNIGTEKAMYRLARITDSTDKAVTVGDIYAKSTEIGSVAGAGTYNVSSVPGALKLLATTADSSDTVNLAAGAKLGVVTTDGPGLGKLNFTKGGIIGGNIGNNKAALELISLNGDVSLSAANVYSPVEQNGGVFNLLQDSQITAGKDNFYTINDGSTVALADFGLTVDNIKLTDNTVLLTLNMNDGNTAGNLVVDTITANAGSKLKITPKSQVNTLIALPKNGSVHTVVTVKDVAKSTVTNDAGKSRPFTKDDIEGDNIQATNALLTLTSETVVKDNVLTVTYTTKRDSTKLVKSVAEAGSLRGSANALFQSLMAPENLDTLDGDALLLATNLGNNTPSKVQETVERVAAISHAPLSVTSAADSMFSATGARLGSVAGGLIPVSDAGAGAAAGDSSTAMGAWMSGFGGQGTQGARKGTSGFKSTTFGGVVGFDTALNDSAVVGFAAGTANSKTKFKDTKVGDTSKAQTYLFSIYGSYDFGNDWLMQGSGLFGNGSVKSKSKRVNGANYDVATGKFDTMAVGGELLGGYNFRVGGSSMVTPLAGLSYMKSTENAYKETGTQFSNLSLSDRVKESMEAIVGIRASTSTDMNGMTVVPEFHGFMNYDFKAKAPKVAVKLSGLGNVPVEVAKPARASFDLGASVTVKTDDMIEYGVAYDSNISDKYFGHQGTFKVRVNF